MKQRTSQLPGFYKVTVAERRALVCEATGVEASHIARALDGGGLPAETADKFVENVLGTYALPPSSVPDAAGLSPRHDVKACTFDQTVERA